MVDYDPQLLLEAPPENVSEKHYLSVPCSALVANRPLKRGEGQTFKMYWKARRNANVALKKRLRQGPNAVITLDVDNMDVVTEREMLFRETEGKPSMIEPVVSKPKVKKAKVPKGLKLAGRKR